MIRPYYPLGLCVDVWKAVFKAFQAMLEAGEVK